MNEKNGIVAVSTISIGTDEYKELVRRSAYLDVIMSVADGEKSYILSEVVGMIKIALTPVFLAGGDCDA